MATVGAERKRDRLHGRDARRRTEASLAIGRRPRPYRVLTRILAGICLGLWLGGEARIASAVDPAEPTVVAPQRVRRPLELAPGKVLAIDAEALRGDLKAELDVYLTFPLDFGVLCDRTGSVMLGPDGTISDNGDLLFFGGMPQAAEIELTGDPGRAISIDVTSLASGGFQLTDFDTSLGPPPLSAALGADGRLVFTVGARLHVDGETVEPGAGQLVGYTIQALYE